MQRKIAGILLLLFFACTDPTGSDWIEKRGIGEPCEEAWECATNYCIPEVLHDGTKTGWKDGMCTRDCDSLCPYATKCISFAGVSLCLPECSGNQDCRDGYVCSSTLGACMPDCRLGWSCGDLVCGENGECVEPDDNSSKPPASTSCSDEVNPTCEARFCKTEDGKVGRCGLQGDNCVCKLVSPPPPQEEPCGEVLNPSCEPSGCTLPNGRNGTCWSVQGVCRCRFRGGKGGKQ